jgi:hypothetical protein
MCWWRRCMVVHDSRVIRMIPTRWALVRSDLSRVLASRATTRSELACGVPRSDNQCPGPAWRLGPPGPPWFPWRLPAFREVDSYVRSRA